MRYLRTVRAYVVMWTIILVTFSLFAGALYAVTLASTGAQFTGRTPAEQADWCTNHAWSARCR